MSRRRASALFLAAGTGCWMEGLAGCTRRNMLPLPRQAGAPAADQEPLREQAASAGVLYGCEVRSQALWTDPNYARLVREQAALIASEHSTGWGAIHPQQDSYDFANADALVSFAETNRLKLRGRTLCGPRLLPAWFLPEVGPAKARGLLESYIARVAGRYAGRMHSWDVVSEPVKLEDGRADGLRRSPWLDLVGPDYLELAFRRAREADPQALLTLHETGLVPESDMAARKRSATMLLLRRLRTRNVPVDAVALASSFSGISGERPGPGFVSFVREAKGLGLEVFLTELQVQQTAGQGDAAAGNLAALMEAGVSTVMTNDIIDRAADAQGGGARQRSFLPCDAPFNGATEPTLLYHVLQQAFRDRRASV